MITKLYKGSVLIDFDEAKHSYFLMPEKERLVSVTSALGIIDKSAALIYWSTGLARDYLTAHLSELQEANPEVALHMIKDASMLHKKAKEKAADIGTQIHDWIEHFIKDNKAPELPKTKEVVHGINAFLEWVDQHKVKFLTSERCVYSKKYKYVGKMDADAIIGGKRCLIDYKSSKALYSSYHYQTAAYQMADEEESGKPYTGNRWLIRLGKDDGTFEAQECDDLQKDYKTFLACLVVKRREAELSKW